MFIQSMRAPLVVLIAGLFCAVTPLVATGLQETRAEAEQGRAEAQHAMGLRCAKGDGVLKDEAAERGDADGQFALSLMYEKGEGVDKHPVEALKWCRLASQQGHDIAFVHQATLEATMTREQVIEAVRLEREWKPAKAEPAK